MTRSLNRKKREAERDLDEINSTPALFRFLWDSDGDSLESNEALDSRPSTGSAN